MSSSSDSISWTSILASSSRDRQRSSKVLSLPMRDYTLFLREYRISVFSTSLTAMSPTSFLNFRSIVNRSVSYCSFSSVLILCISLSSSFSLTII